MKTRLDRLLESIDPERVMQETAARADAAINAFEVKCGLITQWDEFKAVMCRFAVHVNFKVLQLRELRSIDKDRDWGYTCRIFTKLYGGDGEKAAFEMARTGNEGGLYKVLRDFAHKIAEEYAQTEIRARINQFRNESNTDEWLEAADEYIAKYGHLLPSELTESSAARIKANFAKVLEEHSQLMLRLKRIGG